MSAARPLSLQSVFEEACPVYMAYGMTYRQFWDGPVDAHQAYRKAHKLVVTEQNTLAWLHGRYVYDALYAMAPILRAFSKAKKPADYVKEPYPLFDEPKSPVKKDEDQIRYERIKEKVAAFAEEFNRKRHEQEDGKEGDDGNSTGD